MDSFRDETLLEIKELTIDYMLDMLKSNQYKVIPKSNFIKSYSLVIRNYDTEANNSKIYRDFFKAVINDYCSHMLGLVFDNPERLIEIIISENTKWKILSTWLIRIFSFLDKEVDCTQKLSTICVQEYKDKFIIPIKDKIFSTLTSMIMQEREGRYVDISSLVNLFEILEYIDLEKLVFLKSDENYIIQPDFRMVGSRAIDKVLDTSRFYIMDEWFGLFIKEVIQFDID